MEETARDQTGVKHRKSLPMSNFQMSNFQTSRLRSISLLATTILLVVASAWTAPAASARTPDGAISMRFAFGRSAPAAVTYDRLTKAAWRICRSDARGMAAYPRGVARCASSMIEDGVAKIGSPDLATLHALNTRKPLPAFASAGQPG